MKKLMAVLAMAVLGAVPAMAQYSGAATISTNSTWGTFTGNPADQADLVSYIAGKTNGADTMAVAKGVTQTNLTEILCTNEAAVYSRSATNLLHISDTNALGGKYASVGPNATTAYMFEGGAASMGTGGTLTVTFPTAFMASAVPAVVATWSSAPDATTTAVIYTASAASNVVVVAAKNYASTSPSHSNFNWVAWGQRP